MRRLTKLKLAILQMGLTQRETARRAGIDEGRLSLMTNGQYIADSVQRAQIAEALQKPETELFDSES